jgi:hypothetical protein
MFAPPPRHGTEHFSDGLESALLSSAALPLRRNISHPFSNWIEIMAERTTTEVLEDHLRRRSAGDLDGALAHNYAPDIVLLCKEVVFHGTDAVRESAAILGLQMPHSSFDYVSCQTFGEYGYLEWRADSDRVRIDDGADSYVIRDGRIQMQTIHYTPIPKD